jgi:hypothetical protein
MYSEWNIAYSTSAHNGIRLQISCWTRSQNQQKFSVINLGPRWIRWWNQLRAKNLTILSFKHACHVRPYMHSLHKNVSKVKVDSTVIISSLTECTVCCTYMSRYAAYDAYTIIECTVHAGLLPFYDWLELWRRLDIFCFWTGWDCVVCDIFQYEQLYCISDFE